jgi:hypothetical protein
METYLPTLTVAGVLGFVAPLLSTALYKLTWSSKVKQLVAAVVAIVLGLFALLITGGIAPPVEGQDPVVWGGTVLLAVIGVSQLAYGLLWKNSAVDAKIATITSSEAERQKFIEQNTIQSEVIPEDKTGVPEEMVNPSQMTDGPDHRATPGAVG